MATCLHFLMLKFMKWSELQLFKLERSLCNWLSHGVCDKAKSLLLLRYLRTFRGPSWLLCFLSVEFCYICHFCDFCDICHGCFKLARKILVTFAIFAIFADISGPFLASSVSKSWFFLDLLFLRFLRYLSRVFSASKKNPCYFCDICGHFGVLLGFFFF